MATRKNRRIVKLKKKRRIKKKRLAILLIVVALFIFGVFKLTKGAISIVQNISSTKKETPTAVSPQTEEKTPLAETQQTKDEQKENEALPTQSDTNIKKKYTVYIDAGHGGNDKGTIAQDETTFEKDITLKIATLIAKKLSKQDDVEAVLSRTTDVKVSLAERARDANKKNVDLFVSIHLNGQTGGNDASGLETYYTKLKDDGSDKLAKSIQETVTSYVEVRDRGVKTAKFQVLQESKMPGVLIECGFLSNKEEAKKLRSAEYQEKLAEGIAQGIFTYLDEKESN